ncbi:Hypothetical predicted protein [Lecanosticta acicola]|uniref:Uncharacterized protein n=1 Tax=Lecanosticta acicola TaxID=111012 RepID=A0AAI8YRU7_9PEZI|nr:Hypothetical predicted protein [Lecanosticta acicola]
MGSSSSSLGNTTPLATTTFLATTTTSLATSTPLVTVATPLSKGAVTDLGSLSLQSMADEELITCHTYTYYMPTTDESSQTGWMTTWGCWLTISTPPCVYWRTYGTSSSCVPLEQATQTPGFGLPATTPATITVSGPAPIITPTRTNPPSGTGPSGCTWTSRSQPRECWSDTIEITDWAPSTIATCTKWYTFFQTPFRGEDGKSSYPISSTCDSRTEEAVSTSTYTLITETWVSWASGATTILTSPTITATSLVRSGRPSATASASPGSNDVWIKLNSDLRKETMWEISKKLCVEVDSNYPSCAPDTLMPWGVDQIIEGLDYKMNGIDVSQVDPRVLAIDPRIRQNPALLDYTLTNAMGQSFAYNISHGLKIDDLVKLDLGQLAEVQKNLLEDMDNPQQEPLYYRLICNLEKRGTTMDTQEVAAMTSWLQYYFSASFPSPTSATTTMSLDWFPDYCTYVPSTTLSVTGYCNCPGDMPYITSPIVTSQSTKGREYTTTKPCGYTSLPPLSALITTWTTNSNVRYPHATYIAGAEPTAVTVSSAYCEPTLMPAGPDRKELQSGFQGAYLENAIRKTCKDWADKKVAFYPGVKIDLVGRFWWADGRDRENGKYVSFPFKGHNLAMVAEYDERACEDQTNHNVTIGTDISELDCIDLFYNRTMLECGNFVPSQPGQSPGYYPDYDMAYYRTGGYLAQCIYWQMGAAESFEIHADGWELPEECENDDVAYGNPPDAWPYSLSLHKATRSTYETDETRCQQQRRPDAMQGTRTIKEYVEMQHRAASRGKGA